MDPISGISWKNLTLLMANSFTDYFVSSSHIERMLRTLSLKDAFASGSMIEGAPFSAFNISNIKKGIDFDIMFQFSQTLTQKEQMNYFRHLSDEPGYLTIQIPEIKHTLSKVAVLKNGTIMASAIKTRILTMQLLKPVISQYGVQVDKLYNPMKGKVAIPLKVDNDTKNNIKLLINKGTKEMLKMVDKYSRKRLNDSFVLSLPLDHIMEQINIDIVPAIPCEGWPYPLAAEWIDRTREWPPSNIIKKIAKSGYHIIPKSTPMGDKELEWRVSFSKAELILAMIRTDAQKYVYHMFKTTCKEYLHSSDIIKTYHLKTIMMWATEQNPPEYWREDNLAQSVLGLIDDLQHAAATGILKHYFTPKLNLFKYIDPKDLKQVAKEIKNSRRMEIFYSIMLRKYVKIDKESFLNYTPENTKLMVTLLLQHVFKEINEQLKQLLSVPFSSTSPMEVFEFLKHIDVNSLFDTILYILEYILQDRTEECITSVKESMLNSKQGRVKVLKNIMANLSDYFQSKIEKNKIYTFDSNQNPMTSVNIRLDRIAKMIVKFIEGQK